MCSLASTRPRRFRPQRFRPRRLRPRRFDRYGDVSAVKSNEVEQLVCTAMMYCGAIFFAYIVGSFCGLASSLAPDKAQFRFDLSDLNWHMEHENIPSDLRYRLREYVHQTVHLRQV